jgi:uncharacterized membrane protein YgcG
MEQVRVILAWMTKHHFWLLSGLAVLISSLVWFLAAGDLAKRKETNLGTINSAFSAQDTIANRALHPNDTVNQQQQAEIAELSEETKKIWQELYDRQRKEVLKWPPQLPQSFRSFVEGKLFGDDIDQLRREQYTDYIRGRFKDLPKLIDANELVEEGPAALSRGTGTGFGGGAGRSGFGGGAGGGGFSNTSEVQYDENGNPIEVEYTVYWSPEDQERIRKDLDWATTQSHWRIWVTQEDLWVYETMLRAVAATNESVNADRQSNALITDIAAMQVGREAAKESRTKGRIERLQSTTAGTGEEGGDMLTEDPMAAEGGMEEGMDGEMLGRGDTGSAGGDAPLSNAEEKAVRLSRRYIDAEGAPISVPAEDAPLDPAMFGQELKRLPVRMVLKMDITAIPKLMSELANADLQIQVTEVRVGVDPANASGGSSGGGGRGGEFGGGGGGGFGGGGAFGGGVAAEQINVFDRKANMKPVIIQGVVLIFNPPNPAVLESGDGTEGGAGDAGVVSL